MQQDLCWFQTPNTSKSLLNPINLNRATLSDWPSPVSGASSDRVYSVEIHAFYVNYHTPGC